MGIGAGRAACQQQGCTASAVMRQGLPANMSGVCVMGSCMANGHHQIKLLPATTLPAASALPRSEWPPRPLVRRSCSGCRSRCCRRASSTTEPSTRCMQLAAVVVASAWDCHGETFRCARARPTWCIYGTFGIAAQQLLHHPRCFPPASCSITTPSSRASSEAGAAGCGVCCALLTLRNAIHCCRPARSLPTFCQTCPAALASPATCCSIQFGGGGIFGACKNIDISEINGYVTVSEEVVCLVVAAVELAGWLGSCRWLACADGLLVPMAC